MAIKDCFKKIKVSPGDKAAILQAIAGGMSETEAVQQALAESQTELINIANQVSEAGGSVNRAEVTSLVGSNLERIRGERQKTAEERRSLEGQKESIEELFNTLDGTGEAFGDDTKLKQLFTDKLFENPNMREFEIGFDPKDLTSFRAVEGSKATPKALADQFRKLEADLQIALDRMDELNEIDKQLDTQVDHSFSGGATLKQGPTQGDKMSGDELRQMIKKLAERDPNVTRGAEDLSEGQSLRPADESLVDDRTAKQRGPIETDEDIQRAMDTPVGGGVVNPEFEQFSKDTADDLEITKLIDELDTSEKIPDGTADPSFEAITKDIDSLRQKGEDGTRGEILLDQEAQTAIIRLTEAADLSTFLHESGHLFLAMEQRFFENPAVPEEAKADSQAILDWLGVSNFDSIGTEEHEKFARGFEAYLYEGKAPSAELRPAFRRFAAWLQKIYQQLRKLDVKLSPEIIGVFDRMLATDEQIAETKDQLALDPLFKTAQEAGMTPKQFGEYQQKSQGKAEEELRKKALAQLKRTTLKWWRDELDSVEKQVRAELEEEQLYRATAFMRAKEVPGFDQNKMDRDAAYQILGLASPKDPQSDRRTVNPEVDSLSVAIAKLGGLDREEAEAQGIDPAHWANITVFKTDENGQRVARSVPNPDNMVGFNRRIFVKPNSDRAKARTFDEMRELLAEQGMDYLPEDSTASDLLSLLLDDLSGDTQYSKQANFDLLFENPNEVPKQRMKAPAQLRGLTLKGGMDPNDMAEVFGFASGAELVRQIVESPTINFAVEHKANEVMVQRHGDIMNDGTLEAEAIEIAHNTEQGSALLAELRALSGQTNIEAISERKAIKDAAERIIGGKRLNTLRPAQYRAAEVKAARAAQEAMDAGDLEAAQAAKQKQIFNFYLWRAATEARKTADKLQKSMRTMQTKKYGPRQVRPDYVAQLKQFLVAYDFRRSNKQARQNGQAMLEDTKAWILTQQEDPNSPANIIDASQLTVIKHVMDMTLDELTAVHDIAKSLLNAGTKNSKAEKEAFKAEMKELSEHIVEVGPKRKLLSVEDTKSRRNHQRSRAWFAYHRKLESFVRELDAFVDLGPTWKKVVAPLLHANNSKLKMQETAHDRLDVIFDGHEGLFNERKGKQTFTLDSGNKLTLSLGGRIAMALNWGNEGNRTAMLNQHDMEMTNGDVETILATLSDSDLDLVQDIWDFIDSFWPDIAQQERDLTGVVPQKVEASKFTVNGREMEGGYYPLIEDLSRGLFAESDAQLEARLARQKIGSTSQAMTSHGWTNERTRFAGKSIDLNIDVVFNHTEAVIHDLTHRQAVKEVSQVLADRNMSDAIKGALGAEALKAMKNTVDMVAGGNVQARELPTIQAGLRWSRMAVTYGALGFSLKTGFSQTLGLATAIGEFGAGDVLRRGVVDFLANKSENTAFIEERSQFMKDRGKTMHRDVGDVLRGLKGKTTMNALRKKAFIFLLSGDRAISLPVWWGQYQVGLDRVADPAYPEFLTEQDAIDWADRSVSRTQQSGLLMDLATIESKNEFVKMWTVMYSAFSAIYQIVTEQTKKMQIGKIDKMQYTYNIMWLLVIPPLFEEMMTGREDEDEDLIGKRGLKAISSFSLGLMAGTRDISWVMESGRSSELPIQRMIKTPFDAAEQLAQGEIDPALIRTMTAVPALFHIPGGSQLNRSLQYMLAVEQGEETLDSVDSAWELLVTGPREDEE